MRGAGHFHLMAAGMSLEEIMAAPEQLADSLLALFHDFFQVAVGICLAAVLPVLWLGIRKKSSATTVTGVF